MFDIGASELAVIGVTALLVVGPERLPRLARVAGLYIGRARRVVNQVRTEIQRELDAQDLQSIRHIVQRGAIGLEEEAETPARRTEAPAVGGDAGPATVAGAAGDAGARAFAPAGATDESVVVAVQHADGAPPESSHGKPV